MSLRQFLLALRARFGVFALVLAATVLASVLASVLMPKSYKAVVSLLVDAKDEQSMGNPLRPLILPQERLNYMQTQMDIMASRKVARKVVQDLRLTENPAFRKDLEALAGRERGQDELVERLLKNLSVETSQSNVIQASYVSRDPQFAAAIANAFAKAYVDTMLELRVEPTREAAAWFDEQLKTLRANLEEAQAKLTAYYQQKGIISSDEHLDVENARLGLLSEQVARGQEQTLMLNVQEQQARTQLQAGGAPDRIPEVMGNPVVQRLKADLMHGEAKLDELATQYGSNHPSYQRQLSENRSLRQKLDTEMQRVVAGLEVTARQSRQRDAELIKAMADQRARLLKLKETRNELTVLKRNVESAGRAYDTAMQRYVVSQVDSRASQTNVTVLNPAVVPSRPSRPRLALNIALSVAVGVLLGLGIVMLMEMRDRRVRADEDLLFAPNLPLLAVLGERAAAERLLAGPGIGRRALPSPG